MAVLAIRNDTPSKGNIAGNMSPATNLGAEGEDTAGQLTDPREAGVSPERKKSKQSTPAVTLVIKSGWYVVAKGSTPTSHPLHDHVHKRVILDAALDLNKDNLSTSFTNGLCVLMTNAKMVDEHFVLYSVNEGGSKMWGSAGDIPNNMTSVCSHINISGINIRIFERQGNGDRQTKKGMSSFNVIYFSFAIAWNIELAMLISCIDIEWTRMGGSRLMLKALQCFDTMTPLFFYYLFNESQAATILEEFQKTLINTQLLGSNDMDTSVEATMGVLPSMAFHKLVPKVPGQDTLSFKHISHKAQFAHRVWHPEVKTSKILMIKELVAKAKELGCIEAFWGKHMHVTEVATYDSTATELKHLAGTVNRHTNYQCSLTIELLKGIINVDYATSYCTPEGGVQGEATL